MLMIAPLALGQEARHHRARQAHDRGNVQIDQTLLHIEVGRGKTTRHRCSGIVHQQPDALVVAEPRLDTREICRDGQVGGQHIDRNRGLGAQARGQCFHAIRVACHQDEIMATMGQTVGVGGADAGRGAGDQGSSQVLCRH